MSKVTDKPWGSEELIFQGHGYAVKKISLKKGCYTSLHFHDIKHETIMVLTGQLRIFTKDRANETTQVLKSGDSLAIEPKTIHRMFSDTFDCIYFEAQTDHLDDVIRLNDAYGRI